MITVFKVAVSVLPVFGFLGALVFLDSYKLTRFNAILVSLLTGCVTAGLSYAINRVMMNVGVDPMAIVRYTAPLIEEILKAAYILYLMRKKRIGFMVDAVIHGFAIGAGFAFIENIVYLLTLESGNMLLWVIRGLGTAVMHGGTTALFALIAKSLSNRRKMMPFYLFLPGLAAAFIIHSFFNHALVNPLMNTLLQLITLPLLVMVIFTQSEKSLRDWLEVGLDSDVRLLEYIMGGSVARTRIGEYFFSIRKQFPGEVMADMVCFLRLHLELAIRAKGLLMMQGAGFKMPVDKETEAKFKELEYLEKSLGKTGRLAIAPLLHNTTRDLWQLYFLGKK